MATTRAGRGQNDIIDFGTGRPVPNAEITIYVEGTNDLADLYIDPAKTAAAPNPANADAYGNLVFFADWDQSYEGVRTGTNVRIPLELDADPQELAQDADVLAHTTDADDAHDASAISFAPGGTLDSTDVQAAITEVAAEYPGAIAAAIAAHEAAGDPHGIYITAAEGNAAYAQLGAGNTFTDGPQRIHLGADEQALILRAVAGQTESLFEARDPAEAVLMRVRANGNVGIGNAGSATTLLEVQGRAATDENFMLRGFAGQSADVVQVRDSANALWWGMNVSGSTYMGGGGFTEGSTRLTIVTGATTRGGIHLKAQASQTADLMQFRDTASAVLTRVLAGGNVGIGNAGVSTTLLHGQQRALADKGIVIQAVPSGSGNMIETQDSTAVQRFAVTPAGFVTVRSSSAISNTVLSVFTGASNIPFGIQAAASQTADLTRWLDSSAAVLTSVAAGGNFGIGMTPIATTSLSVQTRVASDVALVLKGVASQTGDAIAFQDSAGTVTGRISANGAQIRGTSGSATSPFFSFNTQNNMGMYRVGTDQLGFAVAGAERWRIDGSGILTAQSGFLGWLAAKEQVVVGAAGGAAALPATPTKYLQVKDSAGTTLVIPAYAAA